MYENYYGGYPQMMSPQPLPMQQQYQQRLNTLEQRYPQFSSNPQPQAQTPQIPCRYTSGIEESRAAQITFDGMPNVFIDKATNRIYVKQINLDGNADFMIFKRVEENEPAPAIVEAIGKEDFNNLSVKFDSLQEEIKTLSENVKKFIE